MADIKRQGSISSRVAMPKHPVTSRQTAKKVAPQVQELTKHAGSRVTITNTLNQSLTGIVYLCENNELVLDTGLDYHIVQLSKILKYEMASTNGDQKVGDEETKKPRRQESHPANPARLQKPDEVSEQGHRIYLMLNKTLPVSYHGTLIVVLNQVVITPPYNSNSCKSAPEHEKQLARVRELVKAELGKMQKEGIAIDETSKNNDMERRGG